MKTLIILLLTLCTLTASSQESDNWLTPFATVEFKAGKIMYYYAEADPLFRLTPVFIPGNLVIVNNPMRMIEPETFQYWKETIRDLASVADLGESREEKLHFLKAFTLQTVWSMSKKDDLPSTQAYETVTALAGSNDKAIAESAGLTRDLFESVQNYYQSKNQ